MDSLNCPICYEKFTENGSHEPHVCPCGHTFCLVCLESITTAVCAICRYEFPEGTTIQDLPRNLSVISMLYECSTITSSPMRPNISPNGDINISNMTSKQLLELQESVQKRLIEEKRKEFLRKIAINNLETDKVRRSIIEREQQVQMLKQVIIEEELELERSNIRLLDLEKRGIELTEQASREGIVLESGEKITESVHRTGTEIGMALSSSSSSEPELTPVGVILTQTPDLGPNTQNLNSINPEVEVSIEPVIAINSMESASRLPPLPPAPLEYNRDRDRNRTTTVDQWNTISDRRLDQWNTTSDRRRPRPGQIVPEPINEQSTSNDLNASAMTAIRSMRHGGHRRGGTVWVDSSPSPAPGNNANGAV